jgi:DNA-binding transcriptional MerR regulator
MRPVDLAREHGLSTQAVRNYEDAGVLPPASRTQHGYRVYGPEHAHALRAFVALIPGYGHPAATAILQAANAGDVDTALALIDHGHAELLGDRETLASVEQALRELTPPPDDTAGATFVGPLAHRLGVRPATLRKWERAGLVLPRRDPATGYRVYSPADVRDARLVQQLRRGGYLLARIEPLLDRIRSAGGVAELDATLADWRDRLQYRGRAMLSGAAALDAYLGARPAGR